MVVFGWLVVMLQLLVITGFWGWQHVHHPLGNQLTASATEQMLAYGRLTGLLAAFGCLLQVFLIGRIRWVERWIGLDRLTRIHQAVGFSLVIFLVAHPILVTIGHARQADMTYWQQSLDFFLHWEDVFAAALGLILLLAAIVLSITIIRRRLRYEFWYATHLTIYIALALAFGHQLSVGAVLNDNPWFRSYWIALYIFVFGNLIFFRVAWPLWKFQRHQFHVADLHPEAPGVMSVRIVGRLMKSFPVQGGQFLIVRFLAPGFRWEAHPFSISEKPDGCELRMTIKALGDFTRRIPDLPIGTRVIVDGPHGLFTAKRTQAAKVLLIAGGIGVAPIRAILDDLLAAKRDIVLVYGNRDRNSIVFAGEIDQLVASSGGKLRVVHVMSDDPKWSGERGRVDGALLARVVPDLLERDVFLCGPPPMMRLVRASLHAAGMPYRRIFDERFAL